MEWPVERERSGRLGTRNQLNSIILAAPDIDIDLFRTHLDKLAERTRSTIFLLISKTDGALRVSARLAGGVQKVGVELNSAGHFDEDTSPVIDQILTVSSIRILRNATSGGSRN